MTDMGEVVAQQIVQLLQSRHDETVAMQRGAVEIEIYRDLLAQAKVCLASLMTAGTNSTTGKRALDQLGQAMTRASDAFKRYVSDTLADCLADKALSAGVATAAGVRLYDAHAHLLEVVREQLDWLEHGFHRPVTNRLLFQPYRAVEPADFEMRLAELSSALGSLELVTSRVSSDLTLAHDPFAYLIGSRRQLSAPGAQITAPQTSRPGPHKDTADIGDLRNLYFNLLLFLRPYAQGACAQLTKRGHPAAGANAYTVRDQVSVTIAMAQQATLWIEALRRTMVIASQNIVDAAP